MAEQNINPGNQPATELLLTVEVPDDPETGKPLTIDQAEEMGWSCRVFPPGAWPNGHTLMIFDVKANP